MTKRDVEGAVIVEDVDTKHFGMMKTPDKSSIISIGEFSNWVDNALNADGWHVNYDVSYLKVPLDVGDEIYKKSVAFYEANIGNSDVHCNPDCAIMFGLYYLDNDMVVVIAIDEDSSFWGNYYFPTVYEEDIDKNRIPDPKQTANITHADVDKCKEDAPSFFDEETIKVLFYD